MSAIVLFDGVCNLCSGTVRFIVERDRDAYFRFASIQSEAGAELMRAHGLEVPEGDPTSIVVVDDGRPLQRSDAALAIAKHLKMPWKLLYAAVIIPRFLRDAVYDLVARNRYRVFGKKDVCMVPTPELRARFL
jgi:predicted DCC family thiol-disulfide oxidoreductase YuxK